TKHHPYSDDELVKELAKHGLTVARRTVTKYRKAMKIPSSRQRRDWTLDDGEPPPIHRNGTEERAEHEDEEHPEVAQHNRISRDVTEPHGEHHHHSGDHPQHVDQSGGPTA